MQHKKLQGTLNKKYVIIIHNRDHYWLRRSRNLKTCDRTPCEESSRCQSPLQRTLDCRGNAGSGAYTAQQSFDFLMEQSSRAHSKSACQLSETHHRERPDRLHDGPAYCSCNRKLTKMASSMLWRQRRPPLAMSCHHRSLCEEGWAHHKIKHPEHYFFKLHQSGWPFGSLTHRWTGITVACAVFTCISF